MPSLSDVVTELCLLPVIARRENLSPNDLVRRSGYLNIRDDVTVERLVHCLAKEPELIDAWLMWSDDNRSSPAWYFHDLGEGRFEVGYYDHGRVSQATFDDRILACAEYVRHYLDGFADLS